MKKNKILLFAALATIGFANIGTAEAKNADSWEALNPSDPVENIEITADITSEGNTSAIEYSVSQTINGNNHSVTGAGNRSISLKGDGEYNFLNLGKISDGSEEASTFSYKNLNGETVYKNIEKSVNSFSQQFIKNTDKTITVNINNSAFSDNTNTVFYSTKNATLNITDSIFYNNKSTTNYSIIEGFHENNINIKNSIFVNNNSVSSGGVLYTFGKLKVEDSYFITNQTGDSGGAVKFEGSNASFEKSKFEGNISVDGDGGAINTQTGSVIDYIKNSEFLNNRCNYDGGAISTSGGFIETIDNTVFEGNFARGEGGAIWVVMDTPTHTEKPPVLIKNSIFKNNEAGSGGAISTGTDEEVRANYTYITDSQFLNNKIQQSGHYFMYGAPLGGAILSASNVPMVFNNVDFTGNEAVPGGRRNYSAGGAVYFAGNADGADLKIVDSNFSNNSALEGGALYVENADTLIVAASKDVVFSGNTAGADADDYNGGADIYFDASSMSTTLSLNAADGKKVAFNGSIAAYAGDETTPAIDINKSGLTYNTYDGTTETSVNAGTSGEVQFNARVGDEEQNFSAINLYGGTLSIGQNKEVSLDNPDGLLNDNNFYVKGNSTLNTVNDVVGEFTPKVFSIAEGINLECKLDVDLAETKSDTLGITENNGTVTLSSFNVISDSTEQDLKVKYSNQNVNGTVKDDYTITTSKKTYDVTAENNNDGSFIVFSVAKDEGGLPTAIDAEANQYIITDNQDENVEKWKGSDGNVITSDIDINAKGHSIFTENDLDGMVVSQGTSVILRNIKELSGFNNALTNDGGTLSIIDSNITNNSGDADITNNSGVVNISAATKDVKIGSENTDNALTSNGGTVNVSGSNKVTFDGAVQGTNDAKMNISADTTFNDNVSGMDIAQSSGNVNIKNLSGSDYKLNGGTLKVNDSGNFAPETFELNKGTISLSDESAFSPRSNILNGGNIDAANNNTGNLNFNTLTLNNAINLAVDVDMNKQIMDTITANTLDGNGTIKVNKFNLISETNKPKISINFANGDIKDYVSTNVKTVEGKIFKYNVNYDNKTGQFSFAGGGSSSDGFSPSVLASPVAAQLQGYLTQLNSYDEAFRNMDMYMLLPNKVRQAMKYKNQVAINSSDFAYDDSKTIYDDNTGWLRTHTTFENVPLKNGPKVSNVAYGTYFGGESQLYDLGKGWDGIWGLYAGYNGSHQAYNGISMYQNGGTLGVLGMAYKGNFFQGLTINASANGGEAYTKFGDENFSMLMAGIASKTGYNIEFKEGKYIVQPSLLLSYSFVNPFDYNNSAGIHISSDPLHAIQVEPNIKFIANLKNGWQPYAGVGVVWSIMDKTHYTANDVALPQLSVKPYVKYGVGVRKTWGERFTGFFQTYITNGGRNGVGLQLGFRWALGGKKSKPKENI